MYKKISKHFFKSWITSSEFFYTTVETLPSSIFTLACTLPILLFWFIRVYQKPLNHLPAVFHTNKVINNLAHWFNLTQNSTSLPASFLIFSIHTLNIVLFLYAIRPHLSKLITLWTCWYIGIHPSHQTWLGKLEYLPHVLECTLVLITMIIIKKSYEFLEKRPMAHITIITAYVWPLSIKQIFLLVAGYTSFLVSLIIYHHPPQVITIWLNTKRALVTLFGIEWIPYTQQWLRYSFLLFWIVSIIGLFTHTTKQRQVSLLLLAIGAYITPQILITVQPAHLYPALPAFIAALGLLYENTGQADLRSVIKSLIVPIYASFLFNATMILLCT